MTILAAGATRDELHLLLLQGEEMIEERESEPVINRNDLARLTRFLKSHRVSWSDLDAIVALQSSASKTTVRVLTTLLGTAAWFVDRPLILLPVTSLETVSREELSRAVENDPTGFAVRALSDSV